MVCVGSLVGLPPPFITRLDGDVYTSRRMGSILSKICAHERAHPNSIAPMGTEQTQTERRNIPDDYTSGSMDSNQSNSRAHPSSIAPMDTNQTSQTKRPIIPGLQFRVLVIGKANAGKTSILQRVCDTTESPMIYRLGKNGQKEEVRGPHFVCESDLTANQFKLEPSMNVSDTHTSLHLPIDIVPARRAHHRR